MSNILSHHRLWLFFLVMHTAGATSLAQLTHNVTPPETSAPEENGLRFLLASDATRGVINASTRVTYGSSGTFRLQWLLIDDDDQTVFSQNSASITRGSSGTEVFDRTVNLDPKTPNPDVVLDHRQRYRVRVRLQKWSDAFFRWETQDTATEAEGVQYFHFGSNNSSDLARNVLADTLGEAVFGTLADPGTSMMEGIDGMETFPLVVGYRLMRYDDFAGAAPVASTFTLFVDFTLHDAATDEEIPLENHRAQAEVTVDSWAGNAADKRPATALGTITLSIDPEGILDSTRQHYVSFTLSHEESGATEKEGTQDTSSDRTLLHGNGTLLFGDLATTVTALDDRPALQSATSTHAVGSLELQGAFVTAFPEIIFGAGESISIHVLPDGTAEARNTEAVPATLPLNSSGEIAGVAFERVGAIRLRQTGVQADLKVTLPDGFGVRPTSETAVLIRELTFLSADLDTDLLPEAGPVVWSPASPPAAFFEESKPFWIEGDELHWQPLTGTFTMKGGLTADSIRGGHLERLQQAAASGLLQVEADALKRSNDHLFNGVNGIVGDSPMVETSAEGQAELTANVTSGANAFRSHFPYDAALAWDSGGTLHLENDRITTDTSVEGVLPVSLAYRQSCPPAEGCDFAVTRDTLTLEPVAARFRLTPEGGLMAGGVLQGGPLAWGAQGEGTFTHSMPSLFQEGEFYMPGNFLGAEDHIFPAADNAPASILLQGLRQDVEQVSEAPGTPAYAEGLANYAGLNLRVAEVDKGLEGLSRMAGEAFGPYPLEPISKFYVRESGVTGILDAVDEAFPSSAVLYGYPFAFETFGLNFLSNVNRDSRFNGTLAVPEPADLEIAFEEMSLTCSGQLGEAAVKDESSDQTLAYWQAPLNLRHIRFHPEMACDPTSNAFLGVFARMTASYVENWLLGELGIRPNGHLLRPVDEIPGLNSRIPLPATVYVTGPLTDLLDSDGLTVDAVQEFWRMNPVQEAYLNSAADAPDVTGFWNLFGTLEVPFFVSPMAHLQAPALGDEVGILYAMGGFQSNSQDATEVAVIDATNRGFPGGNALTTYRTYNLDGSPRDPVSDSFLVTARQGLLGIAELHYPLRWDPLRHAFASIRPVMNQPLGVLEVNHRLEYLSPEHGHVKFASQFDAFPQISLEEAFTNTVSEHVGSAQAIVDATGQRVLTALRLGVDAISTALGDDNSALFTELLDLLLDPMLDAMFDDLKGVAQDDPERQFTTFDDVVDAYFQNGGAGTLGAFLSAVLTGLGDAEGFISDLEERLHQLDIAIDALAGVLTVDPLDLDVSLPQPEQGVFGTNLQVVQLLEGLIGDLSDELDGFLEDNSQVLWEYLNEAQPRVDEIKGRLSEVQDRIRKLRGQLGQEDLDFNDPNCVVDTADFRAQLNEALAEEQAAIHQTVIVPAAAQVKAFLNALPGPDRAIIDRLEPLVRTTIKQEVTRLWLASGLAQRLQAILRTRIDETYRDFRLQADSLFATANEIIRDIAEGAVRNVDTQLNAFLGDLSQTVKGGKIDGHVIVYGDTVSDLRLDLEMDMNITEPLKTRAFLQYSRWDSQGPGICQIENPESDPVIIEPGTTPEVRFGAINAPVPGFGFDMVIDAGGQFSFRPEDQQVLGLAGWLQQKSGHFNYSGLLDIRIDNLNAELMLGRDENYVSGAVEALWYHAAGLADGEFGALLQGGFFEGAACSHNPILAWDPVPVLQVGQRTFSGVYVRAQGEFPLLRVECLLDVAALLDLAIFHSRALGIENIPFEGDVPRVGGQIGLGVSGEALCALEVWGKGILAFEGAPIFDGIGGFAEPAFAGYVEVGGRAGVCPFCLEYSQQLGVRVGIDGIQVNFLGQWIDVPLPFLP